MSNSYLDFFKNTFLFSNIPEQNIAEALETIALEAKQFTKNEPIYSEGSFENKLCFVYEGSCEVIRLHANGSRLPLNSLNKYDSFGIVAALTDTDEFPSTVRAKKASTVLFITSTDLEALMLRYPIIAINVSKFLAERIIFLNNKVHTFSGSTVEKKLASYLMLTSKKLNSNEFELNRKKTSELISTGRASLYRALDSLASSGVITYDSKNIYINDPEGLERISK